MRRVDADFDPSVDLIPPAGLERIAEAVRALPEAGFELGYVGASNGSVTATLKIPVSVFEQEPCLNAILAASTVTEALYVNLMEARRLLSRAIAGEPELRAQINRFLR